MLQLPPGATVDPHVFVCVKSPAALPVIAMLARFNVVLPLTFVNMTVLGALLVPTFWLPKARAVGDRPTMVPVPFNSVVWVAALLTTLNVPARAPTAVGVKRTLT